MAGAGALVRSGTLRDCGGFANTHEVQYAVNSREARKRTTMGAILDALERRASYERPPTREGAIDATGHRAGASARTDNDDGKARDGPRPDVTAPLHAPAA